MSWEDTLRRMLPPIGSVSPHITGRAGAFGAGEAEGRGPRSSRPHKGVDANYFGGQQNALNKSHPILHAPVDGEVVFSGGHSGTIAIRDNRGFVHKLMHTATRNVSVGDRVGAGDVVGTMGNTGTSDYHLHYQLEDSKGRLINPVEFWDENGPIDPNPASPLFLDQSRRAAEIFSGLDEKSPLNGTLSPDRPGQPFFNPFNQVAPPNPIADRYAKWASVPLPNAPAASNDPASFADRYGNWASSPAGVLGNTNAPASRTPDQGRRSEIPDGMTPPATTAADGNAPARIPERRLVNLSSPASSDAPSLAPVPQPLLGIFSGQPMRDYPVRPSIFATDDRSSPGDNELYQRWRRWLDA